MRNGFISYAHEDHAVLSRLLKHLVATEERCQVKFWVDTDIDPGRKWPGEIDEAIARSDVILMLVSPDSYASRFIAEKEWPEIKKRYDAGALLVPVQIRPSFMPDYLEDFEAVPSVGKRVKPVSKWKTLGDGLHAVNLQLHDAVTNYFRRLAGGSP